MFVPEELTVAHLVTKLSTSYTTGIFIAMLTRSYHWTLKNSGALVRQRTIPTERPPLVGEVTANFSG
jgi:hypothetical protein